VYAPGKPSAAFEDRVGIEKDHFVYLFIFFGGGWS
jgi:hypothetical protein